MENNILNILIFPFDEFIKFVLGLICHQDESILLSINQNYFPLCPRCIGLHIGFFISLFLFVVYYTKQIKLKSTSARIFVILTINAAAIHWLSGRLGIIEQDSILRLITGLLSGFGFGILICSLDLLGKFKSKLKTSLIAVIFISLLSSIFLFILSDLYFLLVTVMFSVVLSNSVLIMKIVIELFHRLILKNYYKTNTRRL